MLLIRDVNLSPLMSQDCHFLFMCILWIALICGHHSSLVSTSEDLEKCFINICEYWKVAPVATPQCSF